MVTREGPNNSRERNVELQSDARRATGSAPTTITLCAGTQHAAARPRPGTREGGEAGVGVRRTIAEARDDAERDRHDQQGRPATAPYRPGPEAASSGARGLAVTPCQGLGRTRRPPGGREAEHVLQIDRGVVEKLEVDAAARTRPQAHRDQAPLNTARRKPRFIIGLRSGSRPARRRARRPPRRPNAGKDDPRGPALDSPRMKVRR